MIHQQKEEQVGKKRKAGKADRRGKTQNKRNEPVQTEHVLTEPVQTESGQAEPGQEVLKLPEAFCARMRGMLGEEFDAFMQSYRQPRRAGIRINTLKREWRTFVQNAAFLQDPIQWANTEEIAESTAYYCDPSQRPGKMVLHEAGAYYMQEPSAMAVAAISGITPGQRVLDLCAAPGGKSTQAAAMLGGEGLLIANEIHPARARILSQNIERMGIANAIVTNETPERLAQRFAVYFDTVIVDAPCSGEGMFRKEEAAIPNWSPENVQMCAARQREILAQAVQMVAPGGRLVYSTCTFSPDENEANAAWLLRHYPEFRIVDLKAQLGEARMTAWGLSAGVPAWAGGECTDSLSGAVRLWPHKLEGEGHFLAVFERFGKAAPRDLSRKAAGTGPSGKKKGREADGIQLWAQFCEEALQPDSPFVQWINDGPFIRFADELYCLPCELDLSGIKTLRPGLHLGSIRKDRFEPAHALALALSPEDVQCTAETAKQTPLFGESKTACAFLRGESLMTGDCVMNEKASKCRGWCLITAAGYPLGWGKAADERIRNHYPKGLRRFH